MKNLATRLALITSLCLFTGSASALLIQGGDDSSANSAGFCWGVNSDDQSDGLFARNTGFSIGKGSNSGSHGWDWSVDASSDNVSYRGLGGFLAGWSGWVDIWSWFNRGSNGWWGNGWGGYGGGSNNSGSGCQVECGPVNVPEPGTLALFGLGLIGLRFARNRRAAKA